LIVISDRLTVSSDRGHQPSALVESIELMAREFRAYVGLLALVRGAAVTLKGIDATVCADGIDIAHLRSELLKVANRLWLKTAPKKQAGGAGDVDVRPVMSMQELRRCLELRRRVYGQLGYLQENVVNTASKIELDGYDLQAQHFAAVDASAQNRIVGTMRLIVPGLVRDLPTARFAECDIDYRDWCERIADSEVDRVFRDCCLNYAATISLPIFDSFHHFHPFGKEVEPRYSCEISRLVVEPHHRGRGISRLLIEKAFRAAQMLHRSSLLLECAPHHVSMYAKYGFKVLQVEGKAPYYARAQRLDQIAVAMCRNLSFEEEGVAGVHDSRRAATYRLSVHDGPAAGCQFTFESERLTHQDLGRLIDEAPAATDIGGYAAFRPQPAGLVARGRAPLRSQLLASLSSGAADDAVDCLREFLRGNESVSLTIEDREGQRLRLAGQDETLGHWQTVTEILRKRTERSHE
jgi:predicted GNAT family N-acyltransferase